MSEFHHRRNPKRYFLFIPLIIVVVLIATGSFLMLKGNKKGMVSPVPKEPDFEVIFYTPTPSVSSPTSTPSATPKGKKTPTATTEPKPKVSVTPKAKATSTPTIAATPKATPTKSE